MTPNQVEKREPTTLEQVIDDCPSNGNIVDINGEIITYYKMTDDLAKAIRAYEKRKIEALDDFYVKKADVLKVLGI
jgi:hypothetical protein